jgi:thiol-disulfide isomerase/thioredoxin
MRRETQTALAAFGLGLAVAATTVAVILWVTNDMRWMLLLGSVGLLGSALWAGSRRRGGGIAFLLLSSPLLLLHAALVVPELPGLWPHLAIWLGIAVVGWVGFRSKGRGSSAAIAALAILVAAGTWYAFSYVPDAISGALSRNRDEPAPEFVLETLEGSPYPVELLESKVVVLDFFGTWCLPCIAELPEIEAVYRRYASVQDVEVLVVANDSGGDTPEAVAAFVADRDLTVPFLYDPDGVAHRAFGFAGLPGLVVIDRGDRVRFSREGYNAAEDNFEDSLVEVIEALRSTSGT